MPQMSPIWWSTLFVMFLLTYIVFMIMVYFFNIYSLNCKPQTPHKIIKNINWKW